MTGRAKGRARGRARGSANNEGGESAVRPGVPPPAAAAGVQPEVQAPMPGNGRAAHRGGPRGEPRPGGGDVPVRAMQALAIGGGGAGAPSGERGRRRGGMYVPEPHTRPQHITDKRGTSGVSVSLITNAFKMEMQPQWTLYQYHVDFNPEVPNRKLRSGLLNEHKDILGPTRVFDGMILFMTKRLPDTTTEVYSKLKNEDVNVRITIKLTSELPPTSSGAMQMFGVLLKRVLFGIDMQLIGKNYFNPALRVVIDKHKLEVWPGFITSVAKYETSVMLLADISHKILRTNTVLDILYEIYQRNPQNFQTDCAKKLVGEIVLTRYNNKTYRVDDIDWSKNPLHTFKGHDGSEISFKDYYQKRHDYNVTDMEQPLLVSNPKKRDIRRGQTGPILLLPELCTLTGLSDDVRSDFRVMQDIAVHTRIPPESRYRTLTGFINQIQKTEKVASEMEGWGIRFANKLHELQGRVLPAENISLLDRRVNYKPASAEWSGEMRNTKLLNCVALNNWCVIITQRDVSKLGAFLDNLSRAAQGLGIGMQKPQVIQLPSDNTQAFHRALKDQVNPDVQMVLCVTPSNRKDTYDAIKKFCCVEHPVPSQVVVGRTLGNKALMSICTKIAIQLNCKLGGEVWALEIPLKGLMVIGVDCYHDSSQRGRSVAGFIASINVTLTRYYSRCTFQSNMQEMTDGLSVNMQAALKKYHEINKVLPERIVFYRDGVGDGQLSTVSEYEVPQLLKCFAEVGENYNPKFAVVVVKKRINHRFFAKMGQGLSNPPPGTIIDSDVTRPEWYDFFLVSQAVRQGTVTPTHFNVLHDSTGLKPDHLQRLTYKLCHLYYNWPGTVRVPAPCQYAHKLAFLVGQSLHRDPSLALSDKLFFL